MMLLRELFNQVSQLILLLHPWVLFPFSVLPAPRSVPNSRTVLPLHSWCMSASMQAPPPQAGRAQCFLDAERQMQFWHHTKVGIEICLRGHVMEKGGWTPLSVGSDEHINLWTRTWLHWYAMMCVGIKCLRECVRGHMKLTRRISAFQRMGVV